MHRRFDHVAKQILRGVLEPGGAVATELEIPTADAQAVDTWFEPDPAREAERQRMGLLGKMAPGPTMFEPFHDPPGLDDVRACFRKQLLLDHVRVRDAEKANAARPPFPRLWVISSGRPENVLRGYALAPANGLGPGFYEGAEAHAHGVVVLRELPRMRETLLLRLMGAGAVLDDALADLESLPPGAWERGVAVPCLVEARLLIPQDSEDEVERGFIMSTQGLYEEWKRKIHEQAESEGELRAEERVRKEGLIESYETRFGAMPPALRAVVEATHDLAKLHRWMPIVVGRSADEIAAALLGPAAQT